MKRSETEEMYLRTILVLSEGKRRVRRVDIANALNVTKPSVTTFIRGMIHRELVYIDMYGGIHLTEEGRQGAEAMLERYQLLRRLLIHVGVEVTEAEEVACQIEHVITPGVEEKIRAFLHREEGTEQGEIDR